MPGGRTTASCPRWRRPSPHYLDGHANAANAAFVQSVPHRPRRRGGPCSEAAGREIGAAVYDAPHNTVWEQDGVVRHRKGLHCKGVGDLRGAPTNGLANLSFFRDRWVTEAGSFGARAMSEACRPRRTVPGGSFPGRKRVRSDGSVAACGSSARWTLNDPRIRSRADILAEVEGAAERRGPFGLQAIDQVVSPMVEAGLVDGKVAGVSPLLTVKG